MSDNPYISFAEEAPKEGRKTKVVWVVSKSGGYPLGTIKWHGPWRQYCFMPEPNCIFNRGCMESIHAEITRLMDERKAAKVS